MSESGRSFGVPRDYQAASIRHVVALVAILLLAAGLRVYDIDEKSLWWDEFQSLAMACGRGYAHLQLPAGIVISDPPKVIDLATALPIRTLWTEPNGHMPPLYPLVLRFWLTVFGTGPESVRAFSAVMSVAAVALVFLVVRETLGITTGLWAALLMAVASPQVQLGQEARHYTLLLVVSLGAALALLRIERRGPTFGRAAGLTLCVLAMALTHYFAAGALLALAVYAGIRLRGPKLKAALACFLVAGIAWLALGAPIALRQFRNIEDKGTGFLRDAAPGHALRTAGRLASLPVRFFTEPPEQALAPAMVGAAAFALAVFLPLRRRELLFWGVWFLACTLPLALLDLARQTQHLEFIRYAILAAPALYALVAASLSNHPGFLRHVPPMIAALACLLALPGAYDGWWKPDWRMLAHGLDRQTRPGDVTVFYRGGLDWWEPGNAFLHTSYYRSTPQGPIMLLDELPHDAAVRALRDAPGVLIVEPGAGGIEGLLPGAQLEGLRFEPGIAKMWRATWPDAPAATTTTTTTSKPTIAPVGGS